MITQSQCALLLAGLAAGFLLLRAILTPVERRMVAPETGCIMTQVWMVVGVVFIVLAIRVLLWWNAQFQPGGLGIP